MLVKNGWSGPVKYANVEKERKIPVYVCESCGKALDKKFSFCPLCGFKFKKT